MTASRSPVEGSRGGVGFARLLTPVLLVAPVLVAALLLASAWVEGAWRPAALALIVFGGTLPYNGVLLSTIMRRR